MTTNFRLTIQSHRLLQLAGGGTILGLALAIGLLPLPLAIGLVCGSALLVLTLVDPVFPLAAAVLSVPLQELVNLPGGLSVTQACLLLALAALGADTLSRPEQPLRGGRIFWPLACLIWALALSTAFTPFSRVEALRETLRWTTVLLTYLLAVRALRPDLNASKPWRLGLILGCLLIAPAANGLLGIWQSLSGAGPESFQIAPGRARAFGTIGQPNSFAGYMNQSWPLAIGLIVMAGFQFWRTRRITPLVVLLGAGGGGAILLLALLLSYSRGGWVGAAGGGLAMALLATLLLNRQLRYRAWMLVGIGAVLLPLMLTIGSGFLPAGVAGRLASITGNLRLFDVRSVEINPANFAVVERMAHLQAGWNMLQSRPLLGVGPGNYTTAYERTPAAGELPFWVRPWYGSRGHAHNYYLNIAAESGIIGAIAYLALITSTALTALAAMRRSHTWLWRGAVLGAGGVVAAVATHNLFENLHVLNMGVQLGTIWAILAVAALSVQSDRSQEPVKA
ncbi:MAG: O-antigen ligase family protein [Oscillochloris sp.]|nr:O-antigen ligase family protein [Oscillochloris sp.]